MITGKSHGTCNLWESAFSQTPSDFILRKCFLAVFLKNEQLYLRELHSIQTGFSISFYHTFKFAANIGYFREDGKRVAQYDSLFLVIVNGTPVVHCDFLKRLKPIMYVTPDNEASEATAFVVYNPDGEGDVALPLPPMRQCVKPNYKTFCYLLQVCDKQKRFGYPS